MYGYGYNMGYFSSYLLLVLPAILLSLWAQAKVKGAYAKYAQVRTHAGYTGAQIARRILDENGLGDIPIEPISGELTDHYDPGARVVRLSNDVYYGSSVASVGVAAHETGHAVQHSVGYAPLQLRNAIIPVTNIGARLSTPVLFLGLILGVQGLVSFGILLFGLMTLFQLVTLPVEFNASARAVRTLEGDGILNEEELAGTRKVLTAAALTYVAALIVSAAQLLRLILLYGRRRR